nr:YjbH domain-containing protein [uncultured Limnohabitans sp.]
MRRSILFVALLGEGLLLGVHAQTTTLNSLRLSEWLEQQPAQPDAYPLGLVWATPEEKTRQVGEHAALQTQLRAMLKQSQISDRDFLGLQHALHALEPTGRVRVASASGKWLAANPKRDPVVLSGDRVTLPARPYTLRVMKADGAVCEVPHKEGLQAKDYVQACFPESAAHWAWVVQPDGRVQKAGLRIWNAGDQDTPAPGAWLWTPTPSISDDFNLRWAKLLGMQGVASDVPLDAFGVYHRQVLPEPPVTDAFDMSGRYLQNRPSASNWGNVGLLQTPTARMQDAGYFGLGLQRTWPYHQVSVMFQPLDWMETGFRYTSISNRLYSQFESWSGTQSYKDKSIDVKLRAWRESDWVPELAVGWRDMAGTGLFSSEYVVASKRTGRFDWTAGVAWGYLGNRDNLKNPMSRVFGKAFDVRQNDVGNGGSFATGSWFHGPASLFGGVEYQTPWNLVLKAEYDGNNYKADPLGNSFPVKSPINWGLVYRPSRGFDVSAGIERGNTWSFGLTFYTDLSGLNVPKVTDPVLPAVSKAMPAQAPDWNQTAQDLQKHTQWNVSQIYQVDPKTLVVAADRTQNPYPEVRLDKAMTVLHRDAPAHIEQVEIHHRNMGEVMAVQSVNRDSWVQAQTEPARSQEPKVQAQPSYDPQPQGDTPPLWAQRANNFYAEPGLDFIQTLGGADGFILYQFSAAVRMGLKLPGDTEVRGMVRGRLLNNYDKFKDPGSSSLPRVRTHLREYFVTSPATMTNLSISKTSRLSRDWYGTVYAGYFEEMFGGVGGEVLYRQPGSRWAVGADVNQVKQRSFEQNMSFLDYKAKTGHLTGYWSTPIEGVHASLSAGQYLAGDKGSTLTIAKVFANGTTMGAYATKTNVPAALFGEGSFDKGIYWAIPFDAFLTSSSRSYANFAWKPLTRDGGARVVRPVNLYNETVWLNPMMNSYSPSPPANDQVIPDDRIEPFARKR